MYPCCPHCQSQNVQPLEGAFESAQTEALVRRAAPPKKASCLLVIQIWFLTSMALDLISQFLRWPEEVRGLVLVGVYTFSAFAVARAWAYNRYQWPALYQKWQQSFICMECSSTFQHK